jgi:hypothetical protein
MVAPTRSANVPALAERIRDLIQGQPLYFVEIAERFGAEGFYAVSRAPGRHTGPGCCGRPQ